MELTGPVPGWPSQRSLLHRRQGIRAPVAGWLEVIYPDVPPDARVLASTAAQAYRAAFADADLVEFDDHEATYLFDLHEDQVTGRIPRVVAAWTRSADPAVPHVLRHRSRQAGYPMSRQLISAGYERGHLLAHASGGGLDENLFPQAAHINRGRSAAGRQYRRLERLAAARPGCLIFHRLIYGDGTAIPDLTHLVIGLPVQAHSGIFDNRPQAWSGPPTERLRRGQRFHQDVQTAFLAGLVAADAHPEHVLRLGTGRRRVDLLVLPELGGERAAVIVEIKNTDWSTMRADRVRPNLRRHLRQLQEYLDPYIGQLGAAEQPADQADDRAGHQSSGPACDLTGPKRWDAVIGVLLYPRRPDDERAGLIEQVALAQAITATWYDETDWMPET